MKSSILLDIVSRIYNSQVNIIGSTSSNSGNNREAPHMKSQSLTRNESLANSGNKKQKANSKLDKSMDDALLYEQVDLALIDEVYLQLIRQSRYTISDYENINPSSSINGNQQQTSPQNSSIRQVIDEAGGTGSNFNRTGSVRSFKEYAAKISPSKFGNTGNSPINHNSTTNNVNLSRSSSRNSKKSSTLAAINRDFHDKTSLGQASLNATTPSPLGHGPAASAAATCSSPANAMTPIRIATWQIFATILNYMLPNDPKLRELLVVYLNRRQTKLANSSENIYLATCIHRLNNSLKVIRNRQNTVNTTVHSRKATTNAQILSKPSLKELEHSIYCINNRSLFGTSVDLVLSDQQDKYLKLKNPGKVQMPETSPKNKDKDKEKDKKVTESTKLEDIPILGEAVRRKVPWIMLELANAITTYGGYQFEGIFRVPGDVEHQTLLKLHLDKWQPIKTLDKEIKNKMDAAVFASLIKSWYRELEEPLIPKDYYWDCTDDSFWDNWSEISSKISTSHESNFILLRWLVKFLQTFLNEETISQTKMVAGNIAMIWAPNILKCPVVEPSKVIECSVKEMKFFRHLIEKWVV